MSLPHKVLTPISLLCPSLHIQHSCRGKFWLTQLPNLWSTCQPSGKSRLNYCRVWLFPCASYYLRIVLPGGVSLICVWNNVSRLRNNCLYDFLEVWHWLCFKFFQGVLGCLSFLTAADILEFSICQMAMSTTPWPKVFLKSGDWQWTDKVLAKSISEIKALTMSREAKTSPKLSKIIWWSCLDFGLVIFYGVQKRRILFSLKKKTH